MPHKYQPKTAYPQLQERNFCSNSKSTSKINGKGLEKILRFERYIMQIDGSNTPAYLHKIAAKKEIYFRKMIQWTVQLSHMNQKDVADLSFCSAQPQPGTTVTTDTALEHCIVCLFPPQLSRVLFCVLQRDCHTELT